MRRVEHNVLSVRHDIYNIEGSINNMATHVMDMKSFVCNSTPSPIPVNHVLHQVPVVQAACTTTGVPPLGQPVSSLPHFESHTTPQQPVPSNKLGIALLGGEQFEYDKTWVPEPPTIHLSWDIDRLCKEWESSDSTSEVAEFL